MAYTHIVSFDKCFISLLEALFVNHCDEYKTTRNLKNSVNGMDDAIAGLDVKLNNLCGALRGEYDCLFVCLDV